MREILRWSFFGPALNPHKSPKSLFFEKQTSVVAYIRVNPFQSVKSVFKIWVQAVSHGLMVSQANL